MDKSCFIELGSNESSDAQIRAAQQVLKIHFPNIIFGKIRKTSPVNFNCPNPFHNQSCHFSTSLSQEKVIRILKQIETALGRRQEDKIHGIVKIDIDLLVYNNTVLKEKDLQRDYIRAGLSELGYSPT